ncbi:hypothetical protein PCANC_02286 [Puccinia coronata f. sp. avenae]|nr:hypothetical protein PCANC_02286 [Puccinia coronata f. sp. avenae]
MIVVFSCEILTYWTLSHCFLVAIYSSYRHRHHVSTGARRWMPSPILINAAFLIFPIGVVAASVSAFTWFASILNPFLAEVFNILEILGEGSSIWDQLRISTTSIQEKYQLVTNLTQVVSQAEKLGENAKIHFQDVVNSLMIVQWVMSALVCTTALLFFLVFYKLARRFHEQANQTSTLSNSQSSPTQEQRWQSQGDPPSMIQHRSNHMHRTFFDTLRSNQQFLHLIIRAIFIGIAMLTTMTTLVLGIAEDEQTLTNPKWRQALAWLATASGSWSAIPISWHCWRLYKDKTGGTLLNSSASKSQEVALTDYRRNACLEQSSEPVLDEVKLERGFNTISTLNLSTAVEDSFHSRGSLGDSVKNFRS